MIYDMIFPTWRRKYFQPYGNLPNDKWTWIRRGRPQERCRWWWGEATRAAAWKLCFGGWGRWTSCWWRRWWGSWWQTWSTWRWRWRTWWGSWRRARRPEQRVKLKIEKGYKCLKAKSKNKFTYCRNSEIETENAASTFVRTERIWYLRLVPDMCKYKYKYKFNAKNRWWHEFKYEAAFLRYLRLEGGKLLSHDWRIVCATNYHCKPYHTYAIPHLTIP